MGEGEAVSVRIGVGVTIVAEGEGRTKEAAEGVGEPLSPAAKVSPNTATPTDHRTTKARIANAWRIRHSRGLIHKRLYPLPPLLQPILLRFGQEFGHRV
jgi:hypothetical protein